MCVCVLCVCVLCVCVCVLCVCLCVCVCVCVCGGGVSIGLLGVQNQSVFTNPRIWVLCPIRVLILPLNLGEGVVWVPDPEKTNHQSSTQTNEGDAHSPPPLPSHAHLREAIITWGGGEEVSN